MNDDAQMLLAAYDGAVIGQCSLKEVMDVVGAMGSAGIQNSNTGTTTAAAKATPSPAMAPSNKEEPNLLDFFDSAPSVQQSPWNMPVQTTPLQPAVMQQAFPFGSLVAPAAPVLALSTPVPSSASIPAPAFDPFASDIDPFGPGTSTIDDLLGTTSDAKVATTDFFGSPVVDETAAAAAVKRRPFVDPMQGFNTDMFSQPPTPIAPVALVNYGIPSSGSGIASSGSGFDVFDGLGALSPAPPQVHQKAYQHPQTQQQQQQGYGVSVSPPTYGAPMQANYSSSFHSGASSFGPTTQYSQQTPIHQQQQQQQQGGYGFYPQQQQQSGMYGIPSMQTAPPLPSNPPPAAPQQQQQLQQSNPFDGF